MEINPKLEFYVLNYDHNKREVVRFNIFRNINVYDGTIKAVKKHLRNKKVFSYDELKKEILSLIRWQEWGRFEYEIGVGYAFAEADAELKKVDCYWQAEPNIEVITDMAIKAVKKAIKEQKND